MKNLIIRTPTIASFLFAALMIFSSCSKDDNNTSSNNDNKLFFESNMLGHDLTLSAVSDQGTDMTSQFSSYTFNFSKTSDLSGTIVIGNTNTPLTALWSIDATYTNLTISISPAPAPFPFLNDTFSFLNHTALTLETVGKPDIKIITFSK